MCVSSVRGLFERMDLKAYLSELMALKGNAPRLFYM